MQSSLWNLANPTRFMGWSGRILPWVSAGAVVCLIVGLVWGFFFTPDDFRQGSTVKIIYVHVPSAMMAVSGYFVILVPSLIWLIRRHHISALSARAAAPIGLLMTVIACFTGAIWGAPIWGTWWVWDPRLTFFAIMGFFYVGYIVLWGAIEDPDTAADLTSILAIVGSVFALLSRYAVFFWDQGLHQGASLSLDKQKNVADVFYIPLLICIAGFVLLFVSLMLLRTRTEVRRRKLHAIEMYERLS